MKFIFLSLSFFFCVFCTAQEQSVPFRVMWYNVENLFDTENDPEKDDEEFLPDGKRHWTPQRYNQKLRQIAQVITAAGEWNTPALVGLCEVENDSVMTHLINRTPLRAQHYRYCITKGSDKRGINVGILYQRDQFTLLGEESVPVVYERSKEKPTRDILHIWGKVVSGDTLDVFACHFPSRSGGVKETEGYRREANMQLRMMCDSITALRQSPFLILMGDFNDTSDDRNIPEVLGAQPMQTADNSTQLIDLFTDRDRLPFPGSHKYRGEWSFLDHIIVNNNILDSSRPIHLIPESINLFTPSFLLTEDKTERGERPKRTYYGFQYEGGYSDHLPLIIDLRIRNMESN